MRTNLLDQLPLTPVPIVHSHSAELREMSDFLEQLPEAVRLVHEDLCWRGKRRIDPAKGRDGLAAEQVLRIGILKQLTGQSYEALAFSLVDSSTYRAFCRIGFDQKPMKKSRLQKNIKRVKAETWEAINKMTVLKAKQSGIEEGTKARTDCTVVETNIHHPNDSSLLGDCVRVLTRLMRKAKEKFGLKFTNHRLRAKRRVLGISNAKSMKQRMPLYQDLILVTEATVGDATDIAEQLGSVSCETVMDGALADGIAAELKHFVPLSERVLEQTKRRVLDGETVPAAEKLVSIFEPHTDIIIKGARDIQYGHKVCLTTGASALVTDIVVESGNPSDSTLATKMVARHEKLFGKVPRQVVFDGGFAARENVADIKQMGVKDVVFHKRRGIEVEEMASSKRVYKKLRAFRAGIEATISFLKRSFGLARCTWRSLDSFRAYTQSSVLACNLLVVARHLIAARA